MHHEPRERDDPLAALERLHQRGIITQQEAQEAARAITGDAHATFPPPAENPAGDAPAAE